MVLSFSKKLKVWAKSNGFCWYCGVGIEPNIWHVDHFKPIASGGKNDLENLVPCCRSCNYAKGKKSLDEFRKTVMRKNFCQSVGFNLPTEKDFDAFLKFVRMNGLKIESPSSRFWFEEKGL